MIIPIRCFTCNNMIASKYKKYLTLTTISTDDDIISSMGDDEVFQQKLQKSKEVFEQLGITRYCCKRHLLTHVNLIEKI